MPFADTDGIRTHYEVQGEGPPLLLLAPIGDNVPVPSGGAIGPGQDSSRPNF